MAHKLRKPKWPWRDFLTQAEINVIRRADDAKIRWLELNRERAAITNRAIQRAKHAARKRATP
jgi:hypothetical protein